MPKQSPDMVAARRVLRRSNRTNCSPVMICTHPTNVRRDLDNFDSKAVNDALTKSGLLVDDSQIRGKVSWFHDDDVQPGGKLSFIWPGSIPFVKYTR